MKPQNITYGRTSDGNIESKNELNQESDLISLINLLAKSSAIICDFASL